MLDRSHLSRGQLHRRCKLVGYDRITLFDRSASWRRRIHRFTETEQDDSDTEQTTVPEPLSPRMALLGACGLLLLGRRFCYNCFPRSCEPCGLHESRILVRFTPATLLFSPVP